MSPFEDYRVILGTKGTVRAVGICRNVLLRVAELAIIQDFLPLPLGSADVILGVT